MLEQSPSANPAPTTAREPKPTQPSPPVSRVSLVDELNLEGRLEEAADDNLTELDVEASLEASNASPVVSLVDRILVQALERSEALTKASKPDELMRLLEG